MSLAKVARQLGRLATRDAAGSAATIGGSYRRQLSRLPCGALVGPRPIESIRLSRCYESEVLLGIMMSAALSSKGGQSTAGVWFDPTLLGGKSNGSTGGLPLNFVHSSRKLLATTPRPRSTNGRLQGTRRPHPQQWQATRGSSWVGLGHWQGADTPIPIPGPHPRFVRGRGSMPLAEADRWQGADTPT
jgi:hypothetical protein